VLKGPVGELPDWATTSITAAQANNRNTVRASWLKALLTAILT
jgi:hypothetical protein